MTFFLIENGINFFQNRTKPIWIKIMHLLKLGPYVLIFFVF